MAKKKPSKQEIKNELYARGVLRWKLHDVQKEMYDIFYNAPDHTTMVWNLARQSGKCRTANSTILTPTGIKTMAEIQPGDEVIGYNADGTTSVAKVIAKEYTGTKKVYDLVYNKVVLDTCSENHRWLIQNDPEKKVEKKIKDFHKQDKIVRKFVDIPMGDVDEPDAYIIGLYKKNINKEDLDFIKTWNRESCLNFLAGLIDSCTYFKIEHLQDNTIKLSLGNDDESKIETIKLFFLTLFQTRLKDENEQILHKIYCDDGLLLSRVSKVLDGYLRKNKINYNHHNETCEAISVEIVNPREEETWDIMIDNDTSLYLTGDGLVTHNSYLLGTLAIEQCLRKPNSIVKLLSDTKVHVESIILPLINQILDDCPEYLKPEYAKTKYKFIFPNGSELQLAGSDNRHYERLRGQKTDLVLVDEAGFCSNLKYIVRSVLLPTTTHTGGKIVLASTTPTDPNHDFIEFMERAELNNRLTKKTIYDNPMLTREQMESLIEELGGLNSPDCRRELLCELIRDESRVLFPEFDEDLKAKIIKEWPKPSHYDAYVGMDLGYKDLTVVVFGYYDFMNDKIIIEDEIVVEGKDLKMPEFTKQIMDKERELWTNPLTGEFFPPYMRVSDINYLVTEEISRISDYQVTFQAADKRDNDAALNWLRVKLANEKIIISPKCEVTIRHLTNCKWKNKHSNDRTFARSPDGGHYDAVDALKYLVRAVSLNRNPYPANYNFRGSKEDLFIVDKESWKRTEQQNKQVEVFKKVFGLKKD